ncbi:MAG TPA: PLP-dependent aminotransferase family protein [bacterium]|nr:PLP-dependent aminotransferase family protein [bacterium]
MLLLHLDTRSKIPLYRQISNQIQTLVDEGTLRPGDRLPPTRVLADTLSVHRSTVTRAYEELWAMGYIQSRPGSYSTVRRRKQIAPPGPHKGRIPWSSASTPAARRAYESIREETAPGTPGGNLIDMARFDLDCRLFPHELFRRCLNRAMSQGPFLLNYGDPQGFLPLRDDIAQRLRIHGILISRDEILITNGSQNAFELIVRMLAMPQKPVIVESPTYSLILPVLDAYDIQVVPVAMTRQGMDLDQLASALKTQKISFVYTMPNFQNPTGITTDQNHRENLLSLCESHGVPLIEDAFEEEMKYFGRVPLPIKSMDKNHVVLYVGTFSKVLFPGLRLGWIAADQECIRRLLAIKRFSDLSTNTITQAALHDFCRFGHFEQHVHRIHRTYRKRMQCALRALETCMPKGVRWTRPSGGYLIWVQWNGCMKSDCGLEGFLLRRGIRIAMGEKFFPQQEEKRNGFRLSISSLNEEEIETGIRRLGKAMSEYLDRP